MEGQNMTTSRTNIDRRDFLVASGLGILGASETFLTAKNKVTAASRPNILVIMTDQQFAGAMSCAGNPYLKTPAMDKLAEDGVLFTNAYCGNPLCVPSRTVMMTGKMPHETHITTNAGGETKNLKTPMLGRFFADAGYDCGYIGKWHLPVKEAQADIHGFTWFPKGHAHGKFQDAKVHEAVAEFLHQERDKPFLMVASFYNPHDICQWARGEALPQSPIPEPPQPDECPPLPDNFAVPENEPEVIRKVQSTFAEVYPSVDWTEDKWRQYRWAYYRLIEKVDVHVGEVMKALQAAGVADNTLVVFTADHGDGAAAHHWNQKQVLYEEAARVPFIVSNQFLTKAGAVDSTHLVSSGLDLIPTLCDYAGIPVPEGLRGCSVRSLATGENPTQWRDELVCETEFSRNSNTTGVTGRMLRTQQYKYIVYSEGTLREQLFDMENDRGEMQNLAVAPEKKSVLDDCRKRLARWCTETDDEFQFVAVDAV